MTAALANAVLDVLLGEYIEGLDQRQLELDVLNGHLLLQNLTIRSTAIQRALQLPVAVKAGIIGRVELRIPWAHLSSQPTQLRMRNLLLLVGPQSEAHWDRDEEERNALERKRATLLAHERKHVAALAAEHAAHGARKRPTFAARLSARVIERLQVDITNVMTNNLIFIIS